MDDSEEPIRFRPSKKRKTYRQRPDGGDGGDSSQTVDISQQSAHQARDEPVTAASTGEEGFDRNKTSVSALLRARQRKQRPQGLTSSGINSFSSSRAAAVEDPSQSALVPHDNPETKPVLAGISQHFTHQTGMIADYVNDRHMNEFIESRLSSREKALSSGNRNPTPELTLPAQDAAASPQQQGSARPDADGIFARGRILEVDLKDVKAGAQDPRGAPPEGKRHPTGKEGKPTRRRHRRGSDDVARDKLVEELLHENKLDVYDEPSALANPQPNDADADERMAQQFQQQYLRDVAQRRHRRKQPAPPSKGSEEILRGPKLGGSRNVRSQVRDALLQQQEKGNKK